MCCEISRRYLRLLPAFVVAAVVMVPCQASHAADFPAWDWVATAAGKLHDKTRGIAIDGDGNIVMTGEFTGSTTFGSTTLTSVGEMDFFVAKVNPRGEFLWVQQGGGSKIDRGYGIAADASGNIFVTGHYQSTDARFEDIKPTNAGDYDIFVAKYDPQGKLLWFQCAGGAGYDYGHGVATDADGNAIVTGALVGEGKFGERSIGQEGPAHVFAAKLDTSGNLLWMVVADGKGSSSGHGIATDGSGNAYIGGYAGGDSQLGGKPMSKGAARDILIIKMDPKGNVAWVHNGYGSSSALIHEIVADADGNVWACGMFQGELKLADRVVENQGSHDILLTHLDASGARKWTFTAGGPGIDYGLGVATDGQGNSYLTGSFNAKVKFGDQEQNSSASSDIFVTKIDRSGISQWFIQAPGERTEHAYTMVMDPQGSLYLSGGCSGKTTFGKTTIPNLGSNDIFLAKLKTR